MKCLQYIYTDQDGVGLVRVLVAVGRVHGQADAVQDDSEQDEKVERLPLHKCNDVFSEETSNNNDGLTALSFVTSAN